MKNKNLLDKVLVAVIIIMIVLFKNTIINNKVKAISTETNEHVRVFIEESVDEKTYYSNTNKINISGWRMADFSNNQIKAYVDEKELSNEQIINYERKDVIAVIKNCGTAEQNPTPGFVVNINIENLSEGKHTLKVDFITEKEQVIETYESNFYIDRQLYVEYEGHVQNVGWQNYVKNGQTAGTEGQSLRLEAFKAKLVNAPNGVKIKYRAVTENGNWGDWQEDGQISGTVGKSLKLEAIQIKLEETEEYSISYRAHIQNLGWQEWKKDAETAGFEDRRIEAIQIKIVNKEKHVRMFIETTAQNKTYYSDTKEVSISGWRMADFSGNQIKAYLDDKEIESKNITNYERKDVIAVIKNCGTAKQNPKPGFSVNVNIEDLKQGKHTIKLNILTQNNNEVISTYTCEFYVDKKIHIAYSGHVQNVGWQNSVYDGQIAGIENSGLRLEAIKIDLINSDQNAKIKYKTYIEGKGWEDWKNNGEIVGTVGEKLEIEAIKIILENTNYSIEYQAFIEGVGWQEWANDGETSGKLGHKIEAVKMRIVPKIIEKTWVYLDTQISSKVGNEPLKITGWNMTNVENSKLQVLVNGKGLDTDIKRTKREDVIQAIKGYGGEEKNLNPGFEFTINFENMELGNKNIKIQCIDSNNKVIGESEINVNVVPKIEYSEGVYGATGLRLDGRGGSDLTYLKYGNGENVFFATFAIHGYEDKWAKDGYELVDIAKQFYNRLLTDKDYNLADKWTIYVFPGVNMDGLTNGWTNDGPGRTTVYSFAPGNKGVDMNRCWQVGNSYQRFTDDRNYNGTSGFQAYEARYLMNFMLEHKSKKGQTLVVDLHGWTQQLIGDEDICSYYEKQFPENNKSSVGRYGNGYMINWARSYLGSAGKPAKSALIELPKQNVTGHQSVVNMKFADRYITSTLEMLKTII